jgi:hypothetical protein
MAHADIVARLRIAQVSEMESMDYMLLCSCAADEIERLYGKLEPLVAGEDIVERLRLITAVYKDQLGWHSVILKAADEIERLRKEVGHG